MKLRWLVISLIVIALTGCLLPPFDLGVSLGSQLISRMTLEVELPEIEFYLGRVADGEYFFVPSASQGLDHGFLVTRGDAGATIAYTGKDSSGQQFRNDEEEVIVAEPAPEGTFPVSVFPLKNTLDTVDGIYVVASSADREYQEYEWNSFDPNAAPMKGGGDSDIADHVGGYAPAFNSASISYIISFALTGTGEYQEAVTEYTDRGVTDFNSRTLVTVPGSPTKGFYMRDAADPAGTAYLSVPGGSGTYDLYTWDGTIAPGTPATLVATLNYPVQHVLSDGRLYSINDSTHRVLDPNGEELFSFSAGSLYFVGERYLGGEARVLYTLAFWDKSKGDEALFLRVYSHPTAELSSLAD